MHGVVPLGLLILGIWILVLMASALKTGRIRLKAGAPIERAARPAVFWLACCLGAGAGLLLVAMAARTIFRAYLGPDQ